MVDEFINGDAFFSVGTEIGFTFNGDERAEFSAGEHYASFDDFFKDTGFFECVISRKQRGSTKLSECSSDIVLENDDDDDNEIGDEHVNQPICGCEVEIIFLGEEEKDEDQDESDEHLNGARAFYEQQDAVNDEKYDRQIQK